MVDAPKAPRSFQEIILRLQNYWAAQGCAVLQPYDTEGGAARGGLDALCQGGGGRHPPPRHNAATLGVQAVGRGLGAALAPPD